MLLVLHLDEAPLGLAAQQLPAPDRHLTVAANHRKRDVLLGEGEGEEEGEEEGRIADVHTRH